MKFGLTTLSAVVMAAVAAQAAGPPPVETVVNTAIEDFEPLWSPPAGQLRGRVIGIDPAEADRSDVHRRVSNDLSLITAVHLYNLIVAAGGSPVLTRVDDTAAADPDRSAWLRQIDVVRQARCGVCVSIRYAEPDGKAAVCGGAADSRPNNARLADALRAALGVEPGEPGDQTPADSGFAEALRRADRAADIAVGEVCFGCSPGNSTVDAALRKACLDHARRLYAGISRFSAVRASRVRTSAEPAPVPGAPNSDISDRLEQVGRSIWPQGRLPDDRIDWFCRRFADVSITNHSLVHFDVSARHERDVVVLRGRTNVPQVVDGLQQALRAVGLERLRNQVQELPDRRRLGEHPFGVCRVPMALTYDRPGHGGGPQTQLLFGEPLFLLDRTNECYLLHAGDGYWGWVRREAVQPMTTEQFDAYVRHPRGAVRQDIDTARVRIPRGSGVRVVRTTEDQRVILLPDGATLSVPAAAVSVHHPGGAQTAALVRAALDLLYVPYVFGGCSPLGLDCSGLAANVRTRTGHKPPRDAWQQALAGWLVATRWHRADVQPGDQLFFINECGKVYHTGVALDAVHFIHAAPPCVQISSFDPQDPLYDPRLDRCFFLAKRP